MQLVAAFIIGLIIGVIAGLLLRKRNDSPVEISVNDGAENISNDEDFDGLTTIPMMGLIPLSEDIKFSNAALEQTILPANRARRAAENDTLFKTEINENFNILRTNITFINPQKESHLTILVTSARRLEGKTTVALNLARSFAAQGQRTLYFDADLYAMTGSNLLRTPKKFEIDHEAFSPTDPSQFNWLASIFAVEEQPHLFAVNTKDAIASVGISLDSILMKEAFAQWQQSFDVIIIDSPHTIGMADPLLLSTFAQSIVLVARKGMTKQKDFLQATDLIKQFTDVPIIGTVLNGVAPEDSHYYAST